VCVLWKCTLIIIIIKFMFKKDFCFPTMEVFSRKCARFTKGVTEIRQASKYRIILFESLCTGN
jgi:hypothetical protein